MQLLLKLHAGKVLDASDRNSLTLLQSEAISVIANVKPGIDSTVNCLQSTSPKFFEQRVARRIDVAVQNRYLFLQY